MGFCLILNMNRVQVDRVFEDSPQQATGSLHRKDDNIIDIRSLTPPQAAGNARAYAVQKSSDRRLPLRFFTGLFFPVLAALLFVGLFIGTVNASLEDDKNKASVLPACLIGLNLKERPGYALVVEKASQTLRVYEWDNGFYLRHTFPCSTGEVAGKKEQSGDRKTPEGVFFFTKAFEKRDLSPIYGTRAYVMDYPNLMDRKENRDGHNIWLHGTNKPLKPMDTNGCVAMENRHLDILDQYIRLNRTPIIVKSKLDMVPAETLLAEQQRLEAFLTDWKKAFTSGNKTRFDVFYEKNAVVDNPFWEQWNKIRPAWENAKVPFELKLENMAFARGNPCVVALCEQVVTLDRFSVNVGTVKLFLEPMDASWKIVGEEYQPGTVAMESPSPLMASLAQLERLRTSDKTLSELVAEWSDSWNGKDIRRYQACYAVDFYAQNKNLKAWVKYKEQLNKRYKKIRIVVEDLEIKQDGDRGDATFVQRYTSDGHQSVGIKRLGLKRVNGFWKIYRETWHKI